MKIEMQFLRLRIITALYRHDGIIITHLMYQTNSQVTNLHKLLETSEMKLLVQTKVMKDTHGTNRKHYYLTELGIYVAERWDEIRILIGGENDQSVTRF